MIPGYCNCGKPAGRNGKCESCSHAERKLLMAKPALKKKIRKISKKRSAEIREYTALRKHFLSENPACQVFFNGCSLKATDVHHVSTSALNFLNTATWKSVCRHCHTIIETKISAEKRREMGLLM
ncbi:MAG: hypothetical protein EBW87_03595 [Burkholderiaceae bacterium]|nr:hypothetical protein [Burkholderiaceae bacterium]